MKHLRCTLALGVTLSACQLAVDFDRYRFGDAAPTEGVRPLHPAACDGGACAQRSLVGSLAFSPAPAAGSRGRLVDHGFERLPLRCATLEAEAVCLQGGFQP